MANVKARCPQCGVAYGIDESLLGHKVICAKCGQKFRYSLAEPGATRPAATTGQPAPAKPQRDARLPEKVGRFEIRSKLGAGAFGIVYRAFDPKLEREVALKVPHPAALQSEKRLARVLVEAKAAAQLHHPNIVPVYEAGEHGDTFYIASAFIDGQTLEDAIDDKPFDLRRAAQIVGDLARALDYAHRTSAQRKGVVHRDVKPSNVMLDGNGDPLLMDFGLARFEDSQAKLTQDGTVLGTPAYMSPEQADGNPDQVGPASDQYSLGVVLYKLLSGEEPFAGPPAVVIAQVIEREPESPRQRRPEIPRDLGRSA